MSIIEYFFRENEIDFIKEYKFHSKRKWRFDYALIDLKIAIEVEGGNFIQGRHNRGKGYEKDCEKYREAVILGWKLLRYTTNELNENPHRIIDDIQRIIKI